MSFFCRKNKEPGYWDQKYLVKIHKCKRYELLCGFAENKNVLHIGCADWPIFDAENNLHLRLANSAKNLIGLDPSEAGLSMLQNHDQTLVLFTNPKDVPKVHFDLLLIPEVIEHVDSVQSFLTEINNNFDFTNIVITAPDAFMCQKHFSAKKQNNHQYEFTEIVHPDHNCWFSPHTLNNVVKKYTPWTISETFLVDQSVGIIATKPQ